MAFWLLANLLLPKRNRCFSVDRKRKVFLSKVAACKSCGFFYDSFLQMLIILKKIVAATTFFLLLHERFKSMKQLPQIETTLLPWIGKTAKMMRVFITENFKKHDFDLNIEQWILLKMLHDKDGQAQNDLALITERNKASLTRLINTMEKKNYVARIPDTEDKRVNKIFLTTNGRKVFEATFKLMSEVVEELQSDISIEEIITTIEVLKKLQKNIKI